MPLAKFLAYTIAGCILWNSILIYVGYYLGTNWTEVAGISHYILIAVVVSLAAIIVVYWTLRNRERKAQMTKIRLST
jgi:membrane protein DedA with SNARE-associated domain